MEDKKQSANAGPLPEDTPLDRMIKELPLPIPPISQDPYAFVVGVVQDGKIIGELSWKESSSLHSFPLYLSSLNEEALRQENKRLSDATYSLKEWLDKTEWVQKTAAPGELGLHRADVMRERIEALRKENKSYSDENLSLVKELRISAEREVALKDSNDALRRSAMTIVGSRMDLEKQLVALKGGESRMSPEIRQDLGHVYIRDATVHATINQSLQSRLCFEDALAKTILNLDKDKCELQAQLHKHLAEREPSATKSEGQCRCQQLGDFCNGTHHPLCMGGAK